MYAYIPNSLSKAVINVTTGWFLAPVPALAAQRHELVRRISVVLQIKIVR
jgi:hypothetical protein